jgi:phosphoserine phosphatase
MKLAGKGWSERTRAGLERLIESGAGKGHAAVFDFDNTIVCGDIGEATFALLAKEKLIKKDDIPAELAPSFRSPAGDTVSLSTCPDLTVYYEELLGATTHQAGDFAPLSNGYVWAVEAMRGLSVAEVTGATERVHAQSEPFVPKRIEVTPGVSFLSRPLLLPEMIELIAALITNRYEVWIVSASNAWTIRWMALRALNPLLAALGCDKGIAPERVIGVSTLLSDREERLYKDHLLVRAQRRYADMDREYLDGLRLTARTVYPAPTYSGKVACVLDIIGRRPFSPPGTAGRSPHAGIRGKPPVGRAARTARLPAREGRERRTDRGDLARPAGAVRRRDRVYG